MKRLLWIMVGLGALAALLILSALAVGAFLPREHVARGEVVLPAAPEAVYGTISRVEDAPEWRSGVRKVEVTERSGEEVHYVEMADWGTIRYLGRGTPPSEFRSVIQGDDLPFGGSWTFDLSPEGTGTRVTITERGFVDNPFYRFVSRFVIGHETSIEGYLADLERRFPQG